MKTKLFVTLAVAAIFLGVVAYEVKEVAADCAIAWDRYQPSSVNANLDGSFGYVLKTTVVSDFTPSDVDFILYTMYTPSASFNISNPSLTPSTHTVTMTGTKKTIHSGKLTDPLLQGRFALTAWDGTNFECSGVHRVVILPQG